jgi:hypothetical protein
MRILRVRRGFQADHSSSSYLFYAVDHPVSAAGQAIANRYSSSAEVDESYARYVKWGERELALEAFQALLDEHYDVMAEESYSWWTLMIAVPKTPEMKEVLARFRDARGDNDQGIDVVEYRKRMAVTVYCQFVDEGVDFLDGDYDSDLHEVLVELLAKVRADLLAGNTAFLSAVAEFYHAFDEDEEDDEDEDEPSDSGNDSPAADLDEMSKAELQEECDRRSIDFKKSWTKAQLREALAEERPAHPRDQSRKGRPKLSRAARTIVNQLDNP